MSRVIRGSVMVAATIAALVTLAPARSNAENDLGQFCIGFEEFDDTIRLALTQPSGAAALIGVNFRWRSASSPYQIVGTGTITNSFLSPGSFDMALNGVQNTEFFGDNPNCTLFAVLTPPDFSGTAQTNCVGSASPFSVTAAAVFIPCTGDMSVEKAKPSMGRR
jgi:hypothetical protein